MSKYAARILSLADRSLAMQGITGLSPMAITARRGRWYVLHCRTSGHNIRALFLRHEHWLLKIEGMTGLPPEHQTRKYAPRGAKKKKPGRAIDVKVLTKQLSELSRMAGPNKKKVKK